MEVRLKPIRANEWSGIQRYPNCSDALGPYFTRSGSLYTGFTKKNEEDRLRLESVLGYDLKPNSDFWTTFRVRIGDETVVLDLDDPIDELKYIFLKNHKRVKESVQAFKATANYYLSNPEQEAELFNEVNRIKRKAILEFSKLKSIDIKKALRIYGYKSDNISDNIAEDRLYELVENNPQAFLDKWVNNNNRATEYLLKAALAANVIRKQKNTYSYGTTTLGHTLEDALMFIDAPENSDIKAAIIKEAKL